VHAAQPTASPERLSRSGLRFEYAGRPAWKCSISRRYRIARPALLLRCFGKISLVPMIFFALVLCASAPTNAQIIQTIAGGFNPSASPSENACVSLQSVASHGDDVYIASCAQIFKVNARGQFTHVAGTGINAFSPDGTA
jgi:hypothetical protein